MVKVRLSPSTSSPASVIETGVSSWVVKADNPAPTGTSFTAETEIDAVAIALEALL